MADTWRWRRGSTLVVDETAPPPAPRGTAPRGMASQIVLGWGSGTTGDANAALTDHPELQGQKSVVLDLAYEEFCRRAEAGEQIDLEEYCRRFPRYQASLYRLLLVHHYVADPEQAALPAAIRWPRSPESWLGFELVEELGRGSFARVFLARQPGLGNRWVAVKVSPQGGVEAQTLGKLIHDNIVPVHSVEQDPVTGLTAVCMPYRGRATLCDVLDQALKGPWPPATGQVIGDVVAAAEYDAVSAHGQRSARPRISPTYVDAVLQLAIQLADALAHTHAQGVLHLDLKPSNVLLSAAGTPMLLDFNLSFDSQAAKTRMGGTLPYMSPEQIWSSVIGAADFDEVVDHRSDLFSLGVVLYELLTGRMPFGAVPVQLPMRELGEQMLDRQRAGPRPLLEAGSSLEKSLAELVQRCLAYEPSERPQSARELCDALRRQTTLMRRGRRWIARHPLAMRGMAACGVVLLAGAIGFQAMRAPYPERLLRSAQESFQQGDNEAALRDFTACLELNPKWDEARWGLAQTLQRQGEYLEADAEYQQIGDAASSGRVAAARIYCLAKAGYFQRAIDTNLATIGSESHSPETLANLGFCYNTFAKYQQASEVLDRSLRLKPDLPSALFQRARADLDRAIIDPKHLPYQGLANVGKLIQQFPESGDAYGLAVRLHAAAAQIDKAHTNQMFEHWELAIRYGIDYRSLSPRDLLSTFDRDPRFRELLARPVGPYRETPGIRLVPPVFE